LQNIAQFCQRQAKVRRTYHVCLSCERKARKSAPRLCSSTFRIVCQNCSDGFECIPPIDMLGRVVTIQSKQLYLAPCCATIQEYRGDGHEFIANSKSCPHKNTTQESNGACKRKTKHTCAAWNCQSQALQRPHRIVDHVEGCIETLYLCYKHTPPEEWLKRAKNFRQFSATCRAWEVRCKASHKR
jgi:hypothetical protein